MSLFLLMRLSFRRSPQGECGLKLVAVESQAVAARRSPQGECGLKSIAIMNSHVRLGRSPQGECGLKYEGRGLWRRRWRVAPRKGSVD